VVAALCPLILIDLLRVRQDWELIDDNLSKGGWNWGCTVSRNSERKGVLVMDAQRDGERLIVPADHKQIAFIQKKAPIRSCEGD